MMNAPLALFVYNRLEHTKRTVEALMNNPEAKETELFIFSDGPKDETEIGNVNTVREYVEQIENFSVFRRVKVFCQEKNQGLETSVIKGVSEIINRFGKIIVLEDDIITSPDFLLFMNKALDAYQNDPKVWSISAYSLDTKRVRSCKDDVLWTYRGECWGWASWADRWNKVDWEVKDYPIFVKNRKMQRQFNRGGRDMTGLLKKQMENKISSWAIRWCYQQFKEEMITVFPRHPKAYNAGLDGSGTNCSQETTKDVDFIREDDWNFNYSLKNKILMHTFQRMYAQNYWIQAIGKIWYQLTEYEYCLVYRYGGNIYQVLKPNYKEWYADPIPFQWNGKQYVFSEVFKKFKGKGIIGVSEVTQDGKVKRPKSIIEEDFHLSFPSIFTHGDHVFMVPECSAAKQIRIYEMQEDVYHWKEYMSFDNMGELVDSVLFQNEYGNVYLITSEVYPINEHKTRLKLFEIQNFDNPLKMNLKEKWSQKDYSYIVRNGGIMINDERNCYRVAQQSTASVYGKNVIINRIEKLDEQMLQETFVRKITPHSEIIELPKYIYRKWGIHTYGKTGEFEILDLSVQRFSIWGIVHKICRRIDFIH